MKFEMHATVGIIRLFLNYILAVLMMQNETLDFANRNIQQQILNK